MGKRKGASDEARVFVWRSGSIPTLQSPPCGIEVTPSLQPADTSPHTMTTDSLAPEAGI